MANDDEFRALKDAVDQVQGFAAMASQGQVQSAMRVTAEAAIVTAKALGNASAGLQTLNESIRLFTEASEKRSARY